MTHPPTWLADTTNRVVSQFQSEDALAPIGCHYYHDELLGLWEVTVFISHTETVGGEFDGQRTPSRFAVDLTGLNAVFTEVHRFAWQAVSMGADDDLGPHLAVEGRVGKHEIWLRIVSEPPRQFEAGRIADVNRDQLEDRW